MTGAIVSPEGRVGPGGTRGGRIAQLATAVTLLAAIACQLIWMLRRGVESPAPALAMMLPARAEGWTVRDLQLGETEQLVAAAKEILQPDDHVYRSYRCGDVEFAVYIAYWRRNSMPARLVGQHTPDDCWPAQGWRCVSKGKERLVPGGTLPAVDYREFVLGEAGSSTYVLFWHLAEGRLQLRDEASYGEWWRGALGRAMAGSPVQYFVRVSFNRPLDKMRVQPLFEKVLGAVAKLGQPE